MLPLPNKSFIVTGAAGGIGEAYARALGVEGAAVVVADLDTERGEAVAADMRAGGGQAAFVAVDVSDPASTEAMATATVDAFGGIDLLVNNAAIYKTMQLDTLLTVDWAYYRRFMAVNMDGALLCVRACHRAMAARGGGAIVNQSSTAAWMYAGFYGLAKVGVNGLTQQLAHELGGAGIRVNAIAPGGVATPMTAQVPFPHGMDFGLITKTMAVGNKMLDPDEPASLIAYLVSDEAAGINGAVIPIDHAITA